MQTTIDNLVKNLFQKNTLHDVEESELENYVRKFPYAAVGHLLLSKKKKSSGGDYRSAASNAALYVSNPLWVQSFLHDSNKEISTGVPVETEEISTPVHQEAEEISQVIEENHQEIEVATETQIVAVDEPVANENLKDEISVDNNDEADLTVQPAESVDPPLNTSLNQVLTNSPVAQEISFEPYHTIDYFASQGIKLRAEDLTKDKFGRQLKSFTEWLRTMKRVGPVSIGAESTPALDESIQKTAEASVENNEVETEAMAEVWAKQGKVAKAAEIYHKLSLLNPSKSHYFAAKIEQLNAQ